MLIFKFNFIWRRGKSVEFLSSVCIIYNVNEIVLHGNPHLKRV